MATRSSQRVFEFLHRVERCLDLDSLDRQYRDFLALGGVDQFTLAPIVAAEFETPKYFGSVSEEWGRRYLEKRHDRNDPIIRVVNTRATLRDAPLAEESYWDRLLADFRMTRAERAMFAEARDFGYADGYCRLVSVPNSSVFLLGHFGEKLDRDPDVAMGFALAGQKVAEAYVRLGGFHGGEGLGDMSLTERQAEIVRLLLNGWSHKQIAAEMRIAHRTVEEHLRAARKRLRARNSNELIRMSIQHRLI